MNTCQCELPQAGEVFNLAGQAADDPWRIERERIAAEDRRREAEEYRRRAQLTLEQCPGFCGCDAPSGPGITGRVCISPARVAEARVWLKRRYHVSENIGLSQGDSLVFEIAPHNRRLSGGTRRTKVRFGPVEQFTLALE